MRQNNSTLFSVEDHVTVNFVDTKIIEIGVIFMYTVSIFACVMSLEDMDVSESRLKIRNSVLLFTVT
jgi:hypothetical protein